MTRKTGDKQQACKPWCGKGAPVPVWWSEDSAPACPMRLGGGTQIPVLPTTHSQTPTPALLSHLPPQSPSTVISNSLILKIFYSVLKYLFTSTRGRAFGFARLDHRQTRQDMQWRRGGPARCCGPGCWCGELRDMGMGGLPGGSYILPGQGVPQGQLPLLCQPRGAGQQEGSGVQIQPGHGHAACPSPLPASLRSSPPPPPASAGGSRGSVRARRQSRGRLHRCVQYLPSTVVALLSLPIQMA